MTRRNDYLFLRRNASGPVSKPDVLPPGFSICFWCQSGIFDTPPGITLRWRHIAWWFMFRTLRPGLRATVIKPADTKRAVHITYVFRRYFRFPFMGPSDLQIGALWTEPEYRNRGLAKAALGHTLLRLQNERETLWYIVRRDNAPSVAVGRHYGFGGSLEGDRKPLLGIPILGVYRLADAKRPARDREVQKAGSEFVAVSETAGTWVTEEGARMAASRYAWAASLARGRDVLEVGCGSAQGGMLLSRVAKRFVAGDVSEELLARASPVVRNVSQLTQFSAERLPFRDASFDMAIVLEAVYYIGDTKAALSEIRRVLRVGGRVAIVSANPTRRGFIASPHSVQYFSPAQLAHLLGRCGFSEFQCWGAFPIKNGLGRGRFERPVEFSRRIANHLRLVPRTLEGRARLKGILYRKMMRLPEYFTNDSDTSSELERRPIEADWSQYKVIYFVAQRNDV